VAPFLSTLRPSQSAVCVEVARLSSLLCSNALQFLLAAPLLHTFLSNPTDPSILTSSLHEHSSLISQCSTMLLWLYVSTGLCWISIAVLGAPAGRAAAADLVASRR